MHYAFWVYTNSTSFAISNARDSLSPRLTAQAPLYKSRERHAVTEMLSSVHIPTICWVLHPCRKRYCSNFIIFFKSNKGNYNRINRFFFFPPQSTTVSYQREYYSRLMTRRVFTVYGNVLKWMYGSNTRIAHCIVLQQLLLPQRATTCEERDSQ